MKTAFNKYYNKDIGIICADGLNCCYYPILVDIIVNYEEQVFITRRKANVQCSIYYVSVQKEENLTKL